jgi:nuclear transport factor 2 (NTF2) superfamily protein
MEQRYASINDLPIKEADRKYHWDRTVQGPLTIPV